MEQNTERIQADWLDVMQRLAAAEQKLKHEAIRYPSEENRLRSKAEGVALAYDYLRGYRHHQPEPEKRPKCPNHTEHSIDATRGFVGRHFPDSNRWPEGIWEPCDWGLGAYVYCGSHLRPHATGWCNVSNRQKIPLRATTLEDAYAECRAAGHRITAYLTDPQH